MSDNFKILVFGGTGLLGHKLVEKLRLAYPEPGIVWSSCRGLYGEPDSFAWHNAKNPVSTETILEACRPTVVFNCAGITNKFIGLKSRQEFIEVNTLFPLLLSKLSKKYGYKLVHFSTDCVFDGRLGYYTETATPAVSDLYGSTKLMGEPDGEHDIIIRTSFIGPELSGRRYGLYEWLRSHKRGEAVTGYTNAIFSGMTTASLGTLFADLTLSGKLLLMKGLYHVAANPVTKFRLLEWINEIHDFGLDIVAGSLPEKCDRSLCGLKFNCETGFAPASWPTMIKKMLE